MPSIDTIRTLSLKATVEGFDKATDSVKALADAQGGLAVVSDTASKSTLSQATSLNRLQSQLDPSYRSAMQLNAAQTTLGKSFDQGLLTIDRYNQLMSLAGQKFDDVGKKTTPFASALTGVKTQLVALSAGLGPVGVGLASLGPIGLAAGAAIGIASAAFDEMSKRADELAGKAQGLSNFAAITGLTTDQVQALTETSAKLGLDADTAQRFVDSFTSKLTELRTASGSLYESILKVDAGIAQQMLTARSTTEELDLYAKAYKEAAQAGNGNQLLTAAAGRGAVTAGPLVGAIADAGGLNAMNASMDQGSRLAGNEISQLKELKAQNDSLADDIHNNIASLFSGAMLQNQIQARTTMQGLTESMKDFRLSGDWSIFINDIAKVVAARTSLAELPDSFEGFGPSPQAIKNAKSPPGVDNIGGFPSGNVTSSALAPIPAPSVDPTAIANQFKTLVGVLGSAASISDQFNAKLATLVITARAAGVPADKLTGIQGQLAEKLSASGDAASAFSKALSALSLDKSASLQNSYVSALGDFATVQDRATQASLNFQKAQQQNPSLTNTQRDAVVALTAANDEWARASNQAQLGVFDLSAATKAANDQFKAQQSPGGYLDHAAPDQLTAAYQAYASKVQALGEAAKVAGSAFPQLTQLGLDAGNLNKQLDGFATTSLNAVSPALQDMLNSTTSLSSGFQNLGLTAVKALENMIIQMTILKPLASSLSGLLGFAAVNPIAAGGVVPGAVGATSVGGAPLVGLHAGGIVGSEATFTRYVHPAYFDDAPRFHTGGIAGDEVPIIAKKGEGVFTPGQMAAMGSGGGTSITFSGGINISVPPGTNTQDAAGIAQAVKPMIAQVVNEQLDYHLRPRGKLNRQM